MTFLSDLATDASAQGVQFVFFVGNDDAISPAFGTQGTWYLPPFTWFLTRIPASIQNTTFGGTRGFTKQPSTPWYADDGSFGGIVHTERNWTYALIYGTGHQVAVNRPAASFAFARDYIFGSNSSLLEAGKVAFAEVDNPTLTQDVIPAAPEVKFGKGSSSAVATAPAASVSAFYQAIGIETITGTLTFTGTTGTAPAAASQTGKKNGAALIGAGWEKVVGAVLVSGLVATWM
jgi:carboxypeptidase D